jgi:hypothetical protein
LPVDAGIFAVIAGFFTNPGSLRDYFGVSCLTREKRGTARANKRFLSGYFAEKRGD